MDIELNSQEMFNFVKILFVNDHHLIVDPDSNRDLCFFEVFKRTFCEEYKNSFYEGINIIFLQRNKD
jgi:hypothetical protein